MRNVSDKSYLRLQTLTQVVYCMLLFHCNCGCTNAPHCYEYVRFLSCQVHNCMIHTPVLVSVVYLGYYDVSDMLDLEQFG
jgi:hypothetical protein